MKRTILIVFCFVCASVQAGRRFCISDYGACPENGPVTSAISAAVDACRQAGGGEVFVPDGQWTSGRIMLASNVTLLLSDKAELYFPDDPNLYGDVGTASWGLVGALNATNVAIRGKGTLRCATGYWHSQYLRAPARPMNRPRFLYFSGCRNLMLEDFCLRGSPFWTVHLELCRDVVVRGINSVASGPNTDGIDLDSCKDVLVENCMVDQTDDAYVIKSGKNEAGRRRGVPCENVIFRNCRARHGNILLAIGSELSGGVRNITMTDCEVTESCWRLLYVKTNARRGGFVENVRMERCRTPLATREAVMVDMRYADGSLNEAIEEEEYFGTRIDGISVCGLSCGVAATGAVVRADERLPPRNLSLNDVTIDHYGRGAGGVSFSSARSFSIPDALVVSEPEVYRRLLRERVDEEISSGRPASLRRLSNEGLNDAFDPEAVESVRQLVAEVFGGEPVSQSAVRVVRANEVGVRLTVGLDILRGKMLLAVSNETACVLRESEMVVHLPNLCASRKRSIRISDIRPGGSWETAIDFGVDRYYDGKRRDFGYGATADAAAHVDFRTTNGKLRVWATCSAEGMRPHFPTPNQVASFACFTREPSRGELMSPSVVWRPAFSELSRWYDLVPSSGASRNDCFVAVRYCFDCREGDPVRLATNLKGTEAKVCLNGCRINTAEDFNRPPVIAGMNSLTVLYRNCSSNPFVPQVAPCTWKMGAYEPGVPLGDVQRIGL